MAHNLNLNKNTKEYAFFSRKEIPWHGLGKVVEEALTSEEAIKAASLDFEVEKRRIYTLGEIITPAISKGLERVVRIEDTLYKALPHPDKFMTVRTDTNEPFDVVGKNYEIVQNRDAFKFVDSIVGSKEAIFETAGALGSGEVIFITAKLPDTITVIGKDDPIEEYLLFTSSHDGSGAVRAMFTPIRVVCNNTLNLAVSTASNVVKFRHTKSVHDNMKMGLELLGLSRKYYAEFKATIDELAKAQLSSNEVVDKFIGSLFLTADEILLVERAGSISSVDEISTRKKNIIDEVYSYLDAGPGQDLHQGSLFWLYNGVNTYLNNGKNYKSSEDRFSSLVDGTSAKLSQQALNSAINLLTTKTF
jgi:phage/plasmid-like protein (TIGR03299 family)